MTTPWIYTSTDKNKDINISILLPIIRRLSHIIDKVQLLILISITTLLALIGAMSFELRTLGLVLVFELLALLVTHTTLQHMPLRSRDKSYLILAIHLGMGLTILATYMGQI